MSRGAATRIASRLVPWMTTATLRMVTVPFAHGRFERVGDSAHLA